MAFQTHWNRFAKLVGNQMTSPANFREAQRIAQLAYAWGREDATVEQRLEEERQVAGRLNAGGPGEG